MAAKRKNDQSDARQLAVVTGASTGIGFHLAREFASHGFDVVMAADEERVRESAREIESIGAKVYPVQVDLSQEAEVEKLWREVEATGRPVDAIAINAGIGTAGEFADETDLRTELS